ncbi:glycosyltransferase family 2 protein [Paraeggerthella hongkongensis]|uniref:Glycosyltransferase 2-like domain-containing protein n=1 Tax=Paraeggerthella hongkongensis TaxID=230658 RepID=A0A3N0BF20_9ACTN|nr:glycosyltransferase family 2 protein [Paraeggerthella hongkongensis]RNL45780.1 hypothetical protein DMP08_05535 [Paraeggerthella hongkongensis]
MILQSNPTISVVVPVYNVEKYVGKCIESILNQSYKSFELLLIDDGSTDGSAAICKKACERDPRIKYFYKQNGGLSDARNFGLERIRGAYVSFIDSDDWVERNYLEYLHDSIKLKDSDIATCVFMLCRENGKKPWKRIAEQPIVLSSREALLSLLFDDMINVSANGKLLRSSLFADIRFPLGKKYEDVGTTYKLIQLADSVAVGGAPLYNYVMRESSITHSGGIGVFDRWALARQAYIDLSGPDQEVESAAERYYVFHSLSVLRACNLKIPEQRRNAKAVRKDTLCHCANVLENKRTPKRDKAALCALLLGLPFYRLSWAFYAKVTGR